MLGEDARAALVGLDEERAPRDLGAVAAADAVWLVDVVEVGLLLAKFRVDVRRREERVEHLMVQRHS